MAEQHSEQSVSVAMDDLDPLFLSLAISVAAAVTGAVVAMRRVLRGLAFEEDSLN
jgi:hypothetical protein